MKVIKNRNGKYSLLIQEPHRDCHFYSDTEGNLDFSYMLTDELILINETDINAVLYRALPLSDPETGKVRIDEIKQQINKFFKSLSSWTTSF